MSRIMLLRHARAAWPEPGMRDFDRPLHDRGRNDAARLGSEMKTRGLLPAAILCSPAVRAVETLREVSAQLPQVPVEYDARLYDDDATVYMDAIRLAAADPLLVIGHNPMLEDIAHALSGYSANGAGPILDSGFPTCGLAVFELTGKPGELDPGSARLEVFLAPGRF